MSAEGLPPYSADWCFFLDVDGTLLEIAERPELAHVEDATRELLAGVRDAAGGALALISGRSVENIDRLFAPLVLPVAGQHGAERRDAAGTVHRHAFPEAPLRSVAERLSAFADAHAGMLLEDKGHALALHFRLAPQCAEAARAQVESAARELGADFKVQPGKMVYELKPAGRDKGIAVEEYMAEPPFSGRVPVFVGDDLTDEFGFGVVNRLGGHSVKVGDGETAARWRLADTRAVAGWLRGWVAAAGS